MNGAWGVRGEERNSLPENRGGKTQIALGKKEVRHHWSEERPRLTDNIKKLAEHTGEGSECHKVCMG